jgi:aspartate carbamoyltransferase catalytic subunit
MSFKHKNLLGLFDLDREEIETILEVSASMKEILGRDVKKVPTLRGKTVCTLFYEPSTRTRSSFELAAKYLSADTLSIATSTSSVQKGESLKDTARTLEAMGVDTIVMRHPASGACHFLSQIVNARVVNAGDGMHEHPTQGLLDLFTILERKKRIEGLKVALIGDIYHSRVARSLTWGLGKLGAKIYLSGPLTLLPPGIEAYVSGFSSNLEEILDGADVIYVLRIQKERLESGFFPTLREYSVLWGLTEDRLREAAPDAIVMHPGPMNRGVEIMADVAESRAAAIEQQVTNGVAVRMAVLYLTMTRGGMKSEVT